MLMSAFSTGRLLQSNKAKNYNVLNCEKIIRKSPNQTVLHDEEKQREVREGDRNKTDGEMIDTSFFVTAC